MLQKLQIVLMRMYRGILVDHQKDIQSLKEQFMAFIQLKNYTQLTIQNNTTNNYISLARQKLMTVILKQLIQR